MSPQSAAIDPTVWPFNKASFNSAGPEKEVNGPCDFSGLSYLWTSASMISDINPAITKYSKNLLFGEKVYI